MNTAALTDICLQAFVVMLRGFNTIVSALPYTVGDALLRLRTEFPFMADFLGSLTGLLGLDHLTLLEVVFGGITLVLVGSFAKWLRGFIV